MKKSPDLSEKISSLLSAPACILDVGCGEGTLLKSLQRKGFTMIGVDPACAAENRVYGVAAAEHADTVPAVCAATSETPDTDPEICTHTPESCGSSPAELTFLTGTAETLPVQDHWADVVLMQCVFSLCEPETAVRELKRVLKPGGMLIITDLLSGTETILDAGDSACAEENADASSCPGNRADNTSAFTGTKTDDADSGTLSQSSLSTPAYIPRVRRIMNRQDMERWFADSFALISFSDEKKALLQMIVEAIFSEDETCLSCSEQIRLKQYKAGYGMWVWKLL